MTNCCASWRGDSIQELLWGKASKCENDAEICFTSHVDKSWSNNFCLRCAKWMLTNTETGIQSIHGYHIEALREGIRVSDASKR